ncbi:MAG: site-specific integrase [Parcubacteria group bacterium]|nr:site-specific integrase [Parcubacteria group bacterium]
MDNKTTHNEPNVMKSLPLVLTQSDKEMLSVGVRKDGKAYSVREHRMIYFMPDIWNKFIKALPTKKSRLTAEALVQTGARINEVRNIREDDIDYDRNTIKLRITKTKARKGETHGKPRTIPVNSKFIKTLRKHFSTKKPGELIGLLSTSAFNIALKKALKEVGVKDYYMYSAHNIRKTHGNWLKVMGNLKIMQVDAMEICLRLGHDYNTFLKDYGSSGVMDNRDILLIRDILGDLYQR